MHIVVNIDSTNRFSDEDLQIHKKIVSHEAEPEFFSDELLPDSLKWVETILVEMKEVGVPSKYKTNFTQNARRGGKNPKFKDIQRSIHNFGYKLKHVAIALYRDADGKLWYINGYTRVQILDLAGFENIPVNIYEAKAGFTKDQILSDLSIFACSCNAHNDPAGDLQVEDVYREVCHAIDSGWLGDYFNLTDNEKLSAIGQRIDSICGDGIFTAVKRSSLQFRIHNQYNPDCKIYSWSIHSEAKDFLRNHKYVDVAPVYKDKAQKNLKTFGIKWIVVSSSTGDRSFMSAVEMAVNNPDYKVRVVMHTGTITDFDVEEGYRNRVRAFRDFWANRLLQLGAALFHGEIASQHRVCLWGALPAIESLHDLDKIVKFVGSTPIHPTGVVQLYEEMKQAA